MKIRLFFSIFIIAWLLGSCGIYTEVTINADPTADFSRYKTFAWLPDKTDTVDLPYNNEIIRNNLRNYFGRNFVERGYSVNLNEPDLLLQIVITNNNKKKKIFYPTRPLPSYYCSYYYCSDYYSPYPSNYYYRNYNTVCYATGYCKETIKYTESSINLKVIDQKENKLIWSGTAKGDIYDPTYINRSIHPAVEKIMKKFPVKIVK